jgi:pyrroloquinoline quinone biosynthesis protein E
MYRGDSWMKEPCRSCPEKGKDFGGCRCQALALTGDATNADPVCDKSPHHHVVREIVAKAPNKADGGTTKPTVLFRTDANSRLLSQKSDVRLETETESSHID